MTISLKSKRIKVGATISGNLSATPRFYEVYQSATIDSKDHKKGLNSSRLRKDCVLCWNLVMGEATASVKIDPPASKATCFHHWVFWTYLTSYESDRGTQPLFLKRLLGGSCLPSWRKACPVGRTKDPCNGREIPPESPKTSLECQIETKSTSPMSHVDIFIERVSHSSLPFRYWANIVVPELLGWFQVRDCRINKWEPNITRLRLVTCLYDGLYHIPFTDL
jgi:hypothetical protein